MNGTGPHTAGLSALRRALLGWQKLWQNPINEHQHKTIHKTKYEGTQVEKPRGQHRGNKKLQKWVQKDPGAQENLIRVMTLEADRVRAGARVSQSTDTRRGHRPLRNDLEGSGQLAGTSGPTEEQTVQSSGLAPWLWSQTALCSNPGSALSCSLWGNFSTLLCLSEPRCRPLKNRGARSSVLAGRESDRLQ